jgi:hypothetical protein
MRRVRTAAITGLLVLAAGVSSAQTHRRKPAAAAASTTPPANTSWPIETLTVEGNHAYTSDQILSVAGLHVGQTVSKAVFDAARESSPRPAPSITSAIGLRPPRTGKASMPHFKFPKSRSFTRCDSRICPPPMPSFGLG